MPKIVRIDVERVEQSMWGAFWNVHGKGIAAQFFLVLATSSIGLSNR